MSAILGPAMQHLTELNLCSADARAELIRREDVIRGQAERIEALEHELRWLRARRWEEVTSAVLLPDAPGTASAAQVQAMARPGLSQPA